MTVPTSFLVLSVLSLALSLLPAPSHANFAVGSGGSCIVKTAPGGSYGYDEKTGTGPASWGGLQGFETCGKGKVQSPIDFPVSRSSILYRPLTAGPHSNISTSIFSFSAGTDNWALSCTTKRSCGYTMYNGVKYWVANIHFHTQAEHTFNGQQFPLEAHIVHANLAETRFVVVATMFEYPGSEAYGTVIHDMGRREYGENDVIGEILTAVVNDEPTVSVSLGGIVDLKEGICSYQGSLTTPPCTEAVTFLMQLRPRAVSREQVNTYSLTAGGGLYGNNRPVQPLNGRKLTCFV